MAQTAGLPEHGLPVCYQMNLNNELASSIIYSTVFSTSSIVSGNFLPLVSGRAKTSRGPRIQDVPIITPGRGFQNTSKSSNKKPSITPNPPQAAPIGRIINIFQNTNKLKKDCLAILQGVSWQSEQSNLALLRI